MQQQEDDGLATLLLTDLDTHFGQLVESYQHALYRVMYRQVGSKQDAEDIVQETFVRAYYALRDYAAQGRTLLHVRAWLYKIAFNLYYNRIRTDRPLIFSLEQPGEYELQKLEHPDPGPEEQVDRNESLREAAEIIASLPERYKVVLNLYYFAELNYQEIADLLHQPLGTIKAHISRGRRSIRTALNSTQETVERKIV